VNKATGNRKEGNEMIASMIVKRMVMSMANKLNEDDYNVDSFLTWVHDDIVYDSANDLGVGQALKGKKAVAEWYTKYKEEFPKRKMDVWNICFESWPLSLKNVVTLQWSIVETDKQGKSFKIDDATVMHLKNFKIIRGTEYISYAGLPKLYDLMKPLADD